VFAHVQSHNPPRMRAAARLHCGTCTSSVLRFLHSASTEGEDARFAGISWPEPLSTSASPANTVLSARVVLFNTDSDRDEGREDGQAVETVLEDTGRLQGVREDGPVLNVCCGPPHSPSAVQASGVGSPAAGSGLAPTGRSGEASGSRACCEELDSWLTCTEGGRSAAGQRLLPYGRAVCDWSHPPPREPGVPPHAHGQIARTRSLAGERRSSMCARGCAGARAGVQG